MVKAYYQQSWVLNPNPPSHQGGFSLLEILIAMVVVFLVLLGFAGFSSVASKGIKASEKMTRAVTLAQEKLEDLRREGLPSNLSGPIFQVESYGSISGAPHHKRTLQIFPNLPFPEIHTVMVDVQWDNDAHRTRVQTFLLR